MKQHKYERIDKGQKRPKPEAKTPTDQTAVSKYTPQRRDVDGTFLPVVTDEQRSEVIEYSAPALMRGETTDDIGAKFGITGRTVRTWLIGDPRADKARTILLAGEMARVLDEMKLADGPLPLARAREEFRGWSWLAERRLPEYYGQKQEVSHKLPQGPLINITLSTHAPERDITPNPVSDPE